MTDTLREKALKATKGDWKAWQSPDGKWVLRTTYMDGEYRVTAFPALCDAGAQDNASNADFIAAANPTTILSLLDEIDRLREAMTEIAENSRVPLEKSPNESLDVTAAKRLYEAWAKSIAIASQALRSTP